MHIWNTTPYLHKSINLWLHHTQATNVGVNLRKSRFTPLCLKGMLSNTYRLISRILHLLLLLIAQRSSAFVGDTIEERLRKWTIVVLSCIEATLATG